MGQDVENRRRYGTSSGNIGVLHEFSFFFPSLSSLIDTVVHFFCAKKYPAETPKCPVMLLLTQILRSSES
jgi:hypothetical protein